MKSRNKKGFKASYKKRTNKQKASNVINFTIMRLKMIQSHAKQMAGDMPDLHANFRNLWVDAQRLESTVVQCRSSLMDLTMKRFEKGGK